jgi:chemotaxis protein MotB
MNEGTPIIIKKKKAHGHAHHGGSWKVAYADFVTAMMAFFMVMWIMGLSDQTKAQIAGYFNDPVAFLKVEPRSKNVLNLPGAPPTKGKSNGTGYDRIVQEDGKTLKKIQKQIEQAMSAEGKGGEKAGIDLKAIAKDIDISVTREGLQIELVENKASVFFETGSAKVRPYAVELLHRITPVLARSGRRIMLEGHTDARKYPSPNYTNWDLSTDRANSIRRLLEGDGIHENQVVQVRGYAATKLKNPDPFHFSNRRVTLLLPFKDANGIDWDLPAEELKRARSDNFKQDAYVGPDPIHLDQVKRKTNF